MRKLPAPNTLVARLDAPDKPYNVAAVHGHGVQSFARLLPFRRRGDEVVLVMLRGRWISPDGTEWGPYEAR